MKRFLETNLSDGRKGLRGAMSVKVEMAKGAESRPVLAFVASDDTQDRYDEVIDPAGWQLENYKRNPVFQNSHRYGDVIFTLGKSLVTEVREVGGRKALYQEIEFATEINPMAKIAYGLYQGGFLSAVSVGFIPDQIEPAGVGATEPRRIYRKQELLELSAVSIPANPNALALALKGGAVDRGDLNDLVDMLECALDAYAQTRTITHPSQISQQQKAEPSAQAGPSGAGIHEGLMLQLARDLNGVLSRGR